MTHDDEQLLIDFESGMISPEIFLKRFSVNLKNDNEYIRKELQEAIGSGDPDKIQRAITLIWFSSDIPGFIDLLNELLINPNHISHQLIAKTLQDEVPSPTTIPYIRKALESKFDYLEYACSESGVIAKWFSWILYSIGTSEAIELMKEYSHSDDEGIAGEMKYRLSKVGC